MFLRRKSSTQNSTSSRESSRQTTNELLALDFGTSFSKACVRRGKEYIPLELGVSAGGRGGSAQPNPYVLASTLFVHDGRFLFGPAAYEASLTAPAGRRRFDSPKLLFNRDDLSLLDAIVDADVAPGDIAFRQRDLVLMYLGYFTAMAGEALGRLGVDRHVARRYAVPGWASLRATRYAQHLKDLLARAQLLADALREQWTGGISVAHARNILDEIWQSRKLPLGLIGEGMHEATAAGACILNRKWRNARLFCIIDVGAGTTDLAAFVLFRPQGAKTEDGPDFLLAQIKGTGRGVDQAGNVVDETLLRLALDKSLLDERRARAADPAPADPGIKGGHLQTAALR
jgi:molecular chaperone DnaK (HSP70)